MVVKMDINKLINESEIELKDIYNEVDSNLFINSKRVLDAFHNNGISEQCFNSTTGYGYGDLGREKIEKVFAEVLCAEDALVRNQFIAFLLYLDQMICFYLLAVLHMILYTK